jgi:iron complex transport system substrate-binding protein
LKRAVGAAMILLAIGKPVIAAPPHRIMSLKLCTDELLMDLVPPQRIASISYLSQESAALKIWPAASKIPVNHNTAEEVLAVHPDLVLTDNFTTPSMLAMLAKSGAKVVEVPDAQSFAQIRAVTRTVGDAVGARPRAEALIAQMDATLRQLAATAPKQAIRVMGWGGSGFAPGRGSLFDTILNAAGGHNITADSFNNGSGYYDMEDMIAARPDILATGDDYRDTPSLRTDQDDHPLLLKLFAGRRIVYPSSLYVCGLPQSAAAAAALRVALTGAMKNPAMLKNSGMP